MGRRLTLLGLGLVGVGLVLAVAVPQAPLPAPGLSMDRAVSLLIALVPLLASFVSAVGAVTIALGILSLVTGRPPAREHPAVLVRAGVGAWVLAFLLEWFLPTGWTTGPAWPALVVLHVGWSLRLAGAAMAALWLAGLLASHARAAVPENHPHDEDEPTHV